MGQRRPVDVLIVSLGSTAGLRAADSQLRDSLERAGAITEIVSAEPPAQVRTMILTDLAWARAARGACERALASTDRSQTPAIVYSSTTAALLWPRPGAIRFDAPSAGNRPGHHGLWQRPLERRRLAHAPLLLPWSEGGLREAPAAVGNAERALVIPVAVEPSGESALVRDIAAITYAANPSKKGLDRVLAAWRGLGRGQTSTDPGELVVTGASQQELLAAGFDVAAEERVRVVGALPPDEYRALLRRARVFVCAPRREDYGIAQLEALVDGCMLVTTPAPGPYAALPLASALDPRLVSTDLGEALHTALEEPLVDYVSRARTALEPFGRDAIDRLVADALLPRLLAQRAV
jgi:hypothetical protein